MSNGLTIAVTGQALIEAPLPPAAMPEEKRLVDALRTADVALAGLEVALRGPWGGWPIRDGTIHAAPPDVLDSLRLLADAMQSFARHCVAGIEVDEQRVDDLVRRSLMLVTALAPHIGYDRAAKIAKHAHRTGGSLRDAAVEVGGISAEEFERWVDPRRMLAPQD